MNRLEQLQRLNSMLLEEMPEYAAQAAAFPPEEGAQRRLLRSLMNLRPPLPLRADFLQLQDALLSAERVERGVVEVSSLPLTAADPRLCLWRGDITRLAADAVVNAANSALLGCFIPCHGCIDNAIHSAAGLQLRDACFQLMRAQGHEEPAGSAKITPGYNLPARFVLHTVGPIVNGPLEARHRAQLASCYRACLALAAERGLESVAFCCISTGEFHFPAPEAAQIAVGAVQEFLREKTSIRKVIFNVFQERDADLYRALLGPDCAPEG